MTLFQQSHLKCSLENQFHLRDAVPLFWEQIFQITINVYLTQPKELKKHTQGESQEPNQFQVVQGISLLSLSFPSE